MIQEALTSALLIRCLSDEVVYCSFSFKTHEGHWPRLVRNASDELAVVVAIHQLVDWVIFNGHGVPVAGADYVGAQICRMPSMLWELRSIE